MSKRTVVLGASIKEERYSNQAIRRLKKAGHEVIAVGRKEGIVDGINIQTENPTDLEIDTITLYLSPKNQEGLFHYIKKVEPKRVIFNPGTEDAALASQLKKHDIEVVYGCTLVMLSVGTF